MPIPSLFNFFITSKSRFASLTSRLDVGSSRIRIFAEVISSERAIATICWMATEKFPKGWVTSISISNLFQRLPGKGIHLFPVDTAKTMWLMPKHNIFGNRNIGTQVDFLINRADANFLGMLRRSHLNSLPSNSMEPESGCSTPVMTLDQCGFSSSILADQGVDLASFQGKSTFSKAMTPGKVFEMPFMLRINRHLHVVIGSAPYRVGLFTVLMKKRRIVNAASH